MAMKKLPFSRFTHLESYHQIQLVFYPGFPFFFGKGITFLRVIQSVYSKLHIQGEHKLYIFTSLCSLVTRTSKELSVTIILFYHVSMDTANRIQIFDDAVYISLWVNALVNGMKALYLSPVA